MSRPRHRVAAVSMIVGGLLLLGLGPAVADEGADLGSGQTSVAGVTQTSADDSSSSGPGSGSAQPADDEDPPGPVNPCDIDPDNPLCDDDLGTPPGDPGGPGDPGDCLEDPSTCLPDEPDPGNPPDDPGNPGNPGDPGNPGQPGNPGGGDGGNNNGGGNNDGGTQGGPGGDPDQADPAGTVPGAEPAQHAGPATQACSDPSLCQELDDQTVSAASSAAPQSSGDQLAETGAQVPFPAWSIAGAGALLVAGGVALLRMQLRPSRVRAGVHRR